MENNLKKLEDIVIICQDLVEFQVFLEEKDLNKSALVVLNKCGVKIFQEQTYSYDDSYNIQINLYKKSFIETNEWAWAKITIASSKLVKCNISIYGKNWATIADGEFFFNPCQYISDNDDIFIAIKNQLINTQKLTKTISSLDLTKDCLINDVLKNPEVYFSLATEIKNNKPIYFQWVLSACQKDIILLKKLKFFILKDDKDILLNINIKLSMTDEIDKLLLKNSLETILEHKKSTKFTKI